MFFDQAKIYVQGGKGGNGASAFRREKFTPRGGPSGGHGGRGGHVVLSVDPQYNTLVHFKKRSHFKAPPGEGGRGKNQRGANGPDLLVPVPAGTVVKDAETGSLLADLVEPEQSLIAARGGAGGRGNTAFKSSTRQAPRIAERGLPGQERWVVLELKLIADVGIIGVPNAGKSTLLASVTAARPKIAGYPFTTLQPNLGMVLVDGRDFVLADIPGLVEGAHQGVGLGHQFLRHVERTRLLIHLLDGASADPLADFEQINRELDRFNPALSQKPQIIVLNKQDLPVAHGSWPAVQARANALESPAMFVSAATGAGVRDLMRLVAEILPTIPKTPPVAPEMPVFTLDDDDRFTVEKRAGSFYVAGQAVERLAAQTYWDIDEAVERLQQQLEQMGVLEALRQAGVKAGDTVFLAGKELEWIW
ncbi:MAG: GTPase ObgE [Anaerolineae bacterium]